MNDFQNQYKQGDLIQEKYSVIQVFNEENFSLCSIINKKINNELRALKIIKKEKYLQRNNLSQAEANQHFYRLKQIINQMCTWDSPYIVRYYDCQIAKKEIQIQMEYLNGDNLYQYIKKNHDFDKSDVIAITKQALLCMKEYNNLTNEPFDKIQMSDFMYHNKSLKLINSSRYHITRIRKQSDTKNHICQPQIYPQQLQELGCKKYRANVWSLGALYIVLMFWKVQNQYFTYKQIQQYKEHKNVPYFIKQCLNLKKQKSLQDLQNQLYQQNLQYLPNRIYLFPNEKPILNDFINNSTKNTILNKNTQFIESKILRLNQQQIKQQKQKFSQLQKKKSQQKNRIQKLYHKIKRSQYIKIKIIQKVKECNWGSKHKQSKYLIEIIYLFYSIIDIDVTDAYTKIKQLSFIKNEQYSIQKIDNFVNQLKKDYERYDLKLKQKQNSWGLYLLNIFKSKILKKKNISKIQQRQQLIKQISQHLQHLKKQISKEPYLNTKLYHKLQNFKEIVNYKYDQNKYIYNKINNRIKELMKIDSNII